MEKQRERNIDVREKHQCERETLIGCLSMCPYQGHTHNTDMCPEWESDQPPFALQDDAQPTDW